MEVTFWRSLYGIPFYFAVFRVFIKWPGNEDKRSTQHETASVVGFRSIENPNIIGISILYLLIV